VPNTKRWPNYLQVIGAIVAVAGAFRGGLGIELDQSLIIHPIFFLFGALPGAVLFAIGRFAEIRATWQDIPEGDRLTAGTKGGLAGPDTNTYQRDFRQRCVDFSHFHSIRINLGYDGETEWSTLVTAAGQESSVWPIVGFGTELCDISLSSGR
jgi:hypothetical protein